MYFFSKSIVINVNNISIQFVMAVKSCIHAVVPVLHHSQGQVETWSVLLYGSLRQYSAKTIRFPGAELMWECTATERPIKFAQQLRI